MAEIDLNLIRTFVLLYRTRSVTRTAAELSVTQPSVSHGLKRLRRHFADELFVRSPTGLEPTQVAGRLYPELGQALEVIDAAVRAVSTFDPSTSTRTFRLLATDLGEIALLPSILGAMRESAPWTTVEVAPLDFATFASDLRQNNADAAICTPHVTATDLDRDVLQLDRYVGLCAEGHSRIARTPTVEAYLGERHVAVADASGHLEVDRVLSQLGTPRDVAIRVPHFSALPLLVERSDLLGVVPDTVSEWFCRHADVRTFELPVDLKPMEIALYTFRRVLPSPSADWFRTTLVNAVRRPRA